MYTIFKVYGILLSLQYGKEAYTKGLAGCDKILAIPWSGVRKPGKVEIKQACLQLLLVLIGPAEEFFWRGYVQKTMSEKMGANAALVAGGVWGLIYRIKPSLLPALIISHALWDALVFVILPI